MNARRERLQSFVDDYSSKYFNGKKIKILEAGCGMSSPVKYKQEHYIVGIDISGKQLERNKVIDEKIVGDIQIFKLKELEYDLIICWDVLEHLKNPELALENFKNSIKKDGIIIISVPNLMSVKGLITKLTPFFIHLFFYKYILRSDIHRGEDDKGPFKTYLRKSITYKSFKKFSQSNNLHIIYFDPIDFGDRLKRASKLGYYGYSLTKFLFKILSFGTLGESDLTLVIAKK